MKFTGSCYECGRKIIFFRKKPLCKSQEQKMKRYCSECLSNILRKSHTSVNVRPEDRYIDKQGYVHIKVGTAHVYEHIHVMEQILGRKLVKGETVHHNDENRQNNSRENLKLHDSNSSHAKYHALKRSLKNKQEISI
jgi:hypothetical protein